ncbi:hypothetical protein GCM10022268_25710 [Sphingomonas cynarae]|uniref:Uncharacterized protein n=1 Tax=Sphingomonas cynarae TaxID=930197 RepID=A0ABP7E989_9SPHN
MRLHLVTAACAVALCSTPAAAQTSDLARSIVGLIGNAVATSKQRKITAQLSAPLTYEEAAGPRDLANRNDPRNLDIGGVRLGMSIVQAQSALRAAGYTDRGPQNDQPSYIGNVMWKWQTEYDWKGNTNDRAPRELAWFKGNEEIFVGLIALPDGPRVEYVRYQAREEARISKDDLLRRILAKYGEPVNEDETELRWCTIKAPDCEASPDNEFPLLTAWPGNGSIRLSGNDPGLQAALEQRFKADVESRKPADVAPSF